MNYFPLPKEYTQYQIDSLFVEWGYQVQYRIMYVQYCVSFAMCVLVIWVIVKLFEKE